MKTAIRNGKIITYTDTISVQENHSLIIEKNVILDIVPNYEVEKKYPDATTIDATNKAIFSGFANCHTHFRLTLARGLLEKNPHQILLLSQVFQDDRYQRFLKKNTR